MFWHRSEYIQSAGLLYIDSNDFTGIVKTNTVVEVLMVTFNQVWSPPRLHLWQSSSKLSALSAVCPRDSLQL